MPSTSTQYHTPSSAQTGSPRGSDVGTFPTESFLVGLVERIVSRIDELVPVAEPEQPVLNHGDLHPGNLLWHDARIAEPGRLEPHPDRHTIRWRSRTSASSSRPSSNRRRRTCSSRATSGAPRMHLVNQQLSDLLHIYAGHPVGTHLAGRVARTLAERISTSPRSAAVSPSSQTTLSPRHSSCGGERDTTGRGGRRAAVAARARHRGQPH